MVAFDRSLGHLRNELRNLGLADNTILWYCSDNGGLSKVYPSSIGGLRGSKSTIWEGGLRVPAIIEWPESISPKVTNYPASTMDIFPTIADIVGLPESDLLSPIDGISLKSIFNSEIIDRESFIPFRFNDKGALIDNNYKLVATSLELEKFELYNLEIDPKESNDISNDYPDIFEKMKSAYLIWSESVDLSVNGKDYPEGKVLDNPKSHFWMEDKRYEPFLNEWIKRPEYRKRILKGN